MKRENTDVYGEPEIMVCGNVTMRIFRPILTDEERARRMKIINDAAVDLLEEQARVRRQKGCN